jgi:hypothetical protein
MREVGNGMGDFLSGGKRIKAKRGDCQRALLPMQEGDDQVRER